MFEEYLKKKTDKVKGMSEKELTKFMYKNGCLSQAEYENCISKLAEEKDEIKEIDITKDLYLCSPLLNAECPKTSCYINNGPCCYTVDKEYSQEHLLDRITNLHEENERLKIENKVLKEQMVAMVQPNYTYGIQLQGKSDG